MLLLTILLVTVGAGSVVSYIQTRHELDKRAAVKSLAIAHLVASDPSVLRGFHAPHPGRVIDPVVENLRQETGAAFIVVANRQGIRYSHPDHALIGTSLLHDPGENPWAVLHGATYTGVQTGSLGRSMRAKVPLRDHAGHIVGLVSVGILEHKVSAELRAELPSTLIAPLLGLFLGVVGATLLARRVKRQTFGLEPAEIATLLEQREAMLSGIREGAITVGPDGRITMINDEAARLLGLHRADKGATLANIVPEGRVHDVLTGLVGGRDEVVLLGHRVLVVSRMPVQVRNRPVGAIITLRDRTELEELISELDDMRVMAEALRAQEHEFANRLHVIGGLVELGRYEEAVEFINLTSMLQQELAARLVSGVGDPILSALLLGKAAVASERAIELNVTTDGELPPALEDPSGLVTVLGNLIDNALDSAAQAPGTGRVDVTMSVLDDELVVEVHDSGPGIDPDLVEDVFRHGFTTKVARDGIRRRGLGLALVSQEVRRRGGRISVANRHGAVFVVTLPLRRCAPPTEVAVR